MTHLSTLMLHRYRHGELPVDDATEAEAHLASCERCQARMAAADAEDAAIAQEPLPDFLAELATEAELPPSAKQPEPSQWAVFLRRFGMPAVSLLAAASMLLVALPTLQRPTVDDGVRTRGALPDLEVWLQSPDGHRPLEVGEPLSDGDEVVLFYHPHDADKVTLAGRDHTGDIEIYRTLRPVKEGLQPANFALTLDDAPGVQEFFVVAGDRSEEEVVEAILSMEDGVTRVVVPKEPFPSHVSP